MVLRARSQAYPISSDAIIVIVAPHQDDEALGCGGFLARHHGQQATVRIAYVTDGSHSHDGHPTITPSVLAATRNDEARRAMASLGVPSTHLTFLGVRDGSLAHLAANEAAQLVGRMATLFNSVRPQEVFLPSRRDGSSEHDAAFLLVTRALTQAGLTPRLLEFPVWSWWNPLLLLPDVLRIRRVWRVDFRGHEQRKRAALAEYRSQTEPTPPWTQALLSPEFLSFFSTHEEFFFER
jgi:LmbE family N-acetylglucosaminyl deacetylase